MAAWNIEFASRVIEYRLPSISTETLQSVLAMIDIVISKANERRIAAFLDLQWIDLTADFGGVNLMQRRSVLSDMGPSRILRA